MVFSIAIIYGGQVTLTKNDNTSREYLGHFISSPHSLLVKILGAFTLQHSSIKRKAQKVGWIWPLSLFLHQWRIKSEFHIYSHWSVWHLLLYLVHQGITLCTVFCSRREALYHRALRHLQKYSTFVIPAWSKDKMIPKWSYGQAGLHGDGLRPISPTPPTSGTPTSSSPPSWATETLLSVALKMHLIGLTCFFTASFYRHAVNLLAGQWY